MIPILVTSNRRCYLLMSIPDREDPSLTTPPAAVSQYDLLLLGYS